MGPEHRWSPGVCITSSICVRDFADMRVESTFWRHLDEQRRYFPDWTDRPLAISPELEADRNSYLAGGYAEEFGYRATLTSSRGVPVLDEEFPELCNEWRSQARATHPGYPLRPHPFAADIDVIESLQVASETSRAAPDHGNRFVTNAEDAERHGTFMAVRQRSYERERHTAAHRAAAVSTRWAAALVALRWAFRHR